LQIIISNPNCGILIPIPQYPLYTAALALNHAHAVPYYLKESDDWSLDVPGLKDVVTKARNEGKDIRAIVVINPGNPTGNCLLEDNIREIIKFAYEERLILMADEVYQNNIFHPDDRPFVSFKKVMKSLGSPYADNVELISFHSISKGQYGECGRRGGYYELCNFDPKVIEEIYKLASVQLCPPLSGQIGVDLLVKPPKAGEPSYQLFKMEVDVIQSTLKERSQILSKGFKEFEGMSCNSAQGALYLFPSIRLPPKAMQAAEKLGKSPDALYCLRLLQATGICVVPGSGFGQEPNTLHFRTTVLAPGTEDYIKRFGEFHEVFLKEFA